MIDEDYDGWFWMGDQNPDDGARARALGQFIAWTIAVLVFITGMIFLRGCR